MVEKGTKLVNVPSRDQRGGGRWLYGINAVTRRLTVNPTSILELHVLARSSGRVAETERLAGAHHVPVRQTDEPTLRRLTGTAAHQGVAAKAEAFRYEELDAVSGRSGGILILDQMNDPQNFGALIRSAAAAGMAGIVIPRNGAVGVTATVEKVAAGAVNDIPICQVVNLVRTIDKLRSKGYWSLGLISAGGSDLFTMDIPEPVVLVVGGETGIRPLVERTCDFKASIPMRGATESLNASAAGAIAMFEILRRHRSGLVGLTRS